MIDNKKVINCISAVVNFYEVRSSTTEFDDVAIGQLIDEVIMMLKVNFLEEEREKVRKEVYYRCQIKANDGEMLIDDYHHYRWYDERPSKDNYFWDRYRTYLLEDCGFGLNIVNKLEKETLRELTNCIGDPKATSPYLRRGLIIGDVQSGKTSTYTGLICKAADAGYKVIILLTGTIESLRTQTQQRIEEGFVGYDSSKFVPSDSDYFVGVGKRDRQIKVTVLTSREDDFTSVASRIITSIQSNKIVLFVVKKNVTVLTKLINWLSTRNADLDGKIHYPMLMIDDEADNASVNTRKEDEDPTRTNTLIRKLADIFTQSNYVGFTATPFANIFINPTTTEEMENCDLFPENFIYCLPTPQDYIGSNSIFSVDGHYHNALIPITDAGMEKDEGYSFFCKHQKYWDDELPKSLTDAVYAFLLANAIRDLRHDYTAHRSMLINISRFVAVQWVIRKNVENIIDKIHNAIKFDLTPNESCFSNSYLSKLHSVWESEYSDLEFSWLDICGVLLKSIEPVQIRVVNSSRSSERLNYNDYYKEGLRVIAIGGAALSRGLTLEGLIVSYFFRNTATYDVLMQMGRWFGYRRGYEDLFRIWIGEKSSEWYRDISNATELLKQDMGRMRELGRTPKDFGIRVRNDSSELGITARNKMRTATTTVEYESYFGSLVQASNILDDLKTNINNRRIVEESIKEALADGAYYANINGKEIIRNVGKGIILSILSSIKLHKKNTRFITKDICENIAKCSDASLEEWDIAIVEGAKSNDVQPFGLLGKLYYPISRTIIHYPEENRISVSTRGQLTGPSDAQRGLEQKDIDEVDELFVREEKTGVFSGTIPAKAYFKYLKRRKPLLLVYVIKFSKGTFDRSDKNNPIVDNSAFIKRFGTYGISFAVGMPSTDNADLMRIHCYAVNRVYVSDHDESEEE